MNEWMNIRERERELIYSFQWIIITTTTSSLTFVESTLLYSAFPSCNLEDSVMLFVFFDDYITYYHYDEDYYDNDNG